MSTVWPGATPPAGNCPGFAITPTKANPLGGHWPADSSARMRSAGNETHGGSATDDVDGVSRRNRSDRGRVRKSGCADVGGLDLVSLGNETIYDEHPCLMSRLRIQACERGCARRDQHQRAHGEPWAALAPPYAEPQVLRNWCAR